MDLHDALGKKRVTTRWDLEHRKDGIRGRFVAREFLGDGTMYDVFAPSSTPSHGTRHRLPVPQEVVTNAYFHVDEDEECCDDPPADWLEQQAALGNPTSVLWRLRKQLYGWRLAGTRWVDCMAEHLEEQSFEKCDAAPQYLANYELGVFTEAHG